MDTLIEIRRLMKEGKQARGHAQVLGTGGANMFTRFVELFFFTLEFTCDSCVF